MESVLSSGLPRLGGLMMFSSRLGMVAWVDVGWSPFGGVVGWRGFQDHMLKSRP